MNKQANTIVPFLALRPDEMIHLSEAPYGQEPGYAVMFIETPPFPGDSYAEGAQLIVVCAGQYIADATQSLERLWGWIHLEASTKEIVANALSLIHAAPGRWYFMRIFVGLGNRPINHFDIITAMGVGGERG